MIIIFKEFTINNKTVKKAVIQGGMGIGVSLSNLAGAVAREGSVGVISSAHPAYNHPDFYSKNTLELNLETLGYHIKKAKEISSNGVIGVNIMWAGKNYEKFVKCCIDNGADLIVSGAGLPTELPKYAGNSDINIAPIVSSSKALTIILRLWDKRYKKTADMIVFEGKKAGGHLGFKPEQLDSEDDINDLSETIKIRDEYEKIYNKKIPIIFGGGIFYKSDVEKYLRLGFDGIQVATRFIATEECDASDNYKKRYLGVNKDDIVITKSPVGMPGRAIKNKFLEKIEQGRIPAENCVNCIRVCKPAETPYCITNALKNAVMGNCDDGLLFCGANTHLLKEITTVKKVFEDLGV